MRIEVTITRGDAVLAHAVENGVGRETYVAMPDVARLPSVRAALDQVLNARAAGTALGVVCREAARRHMAWRHREDEPMLRDSVRLHWAPGATRQWREEEKWLPEGHTTLTVDIMTDAAGMMDIPLAA
jgi:hypothetical protein